MAYIQFLDSDEIEYLREYHTFGRRTEAVDTHLAFPYISKLHAVIEWKKPHWMLRDVSSNGVWLNGQRVQPQVRHVLSQGDLVELSGSKGVRLNIANLDAPKEMLVSCESILQTIRLNPKGVLIPNKDSPELALHKCPDRLQWFSESIAPNQEELPLAIEEHETLNVTETPSPYEAGPYAHGDLIRVGGQEWRFYLLSENDVTTELQPQSKNIDDVEFRFDISQDEETTELTLLYKHHEYGLGERSHHYLIAHLLRYKAQLRQGEGVGKGGEQATSHLGWMDCQLLASELGLDESHLNILIYRARKQVSSELLGFVGSSRFIERRRGQVRIGVDNFSIYKEGLKEV